MSHERVLQQLNEAALPDEVRFFRRHVREWALTHRGEFVVIGRGTFAGFHKTYSDAMNAGVRAFGPLAPFLVKPVQVHEEEE